MNEIHYNIFLFLPTYIYISNAFLPVAAAAWNPILRLSFYLLTLCRREGEKKEKKVFYVWNKSLFTFTLLIVYSEVLTVPFNRILACPLTEINESYSYFLFIPEYINLNRKLVTSNDLWDKIFCRLLYRHKRKRTKKKISVLTFFLSKKFTEYKIIDWKRDKQAAVIV